LRLTLIAGLMFVAAPALAAPPPSGPIVKDGVEITISPNGHSSQGVVEVTLDVEARADVAANRLGFRSMRGVTAVDCLKGANRFVKADAYAQADLKGAVTPRVVSGDWVRPSDDSFMYAVTLRVCGDPTPAPAPPKPGRLPVVTMGTTATAPTSSAPTSPAPTTPPSTAPTPPIRVAMAVSAKPAPSSPPSPPTFRASAAGRGVAQVAASPTAQDAQHVLDRLHSLITPPLTSGVEPVMVHNAQLFRASVTGFVSLGDAQAFCARAASVSKTCWVHWKAAAPAKPGHP
jgi:hypothetical protein